MAQSADRPIPPDDALPGRDGPIWSEEPVPVVVLGVDPSESSGFCILSGESIESGSIDLYKPGGVETVVRRAIDRAVETGSPLVMTIEHSKNTFNPRNKKRGSFGVSGFIGMMRAQGVWLRTFRAEVRAANTRLSTPRAGRRHILLESRIVTIQANAWRTAVFGTVQYRDPVTKRPYRLQRSHWKYLAVRSVREWFGIDAGDDEAEAVLIAWYGRFRAVL